MHLEIIEKATGLATLTVLVIGFALYVILSLFALWIAIERGDFKRNKQTNCRLNFEKVFQFAGASLIIVTTLYLIWITLMTHTQRGNW